MSETQTEQETPATVPDETPDETSQEAPETPQEPTPDEPDAEPVEAPQEPQEPSEEPQSTVQDNVAIEKAQDSALKSWATFERNMLSRYEGTGVRLAECPLCPTQHKGFVDIDYAGRVPQEVQDNVRMFFGFAREQDYELDTDYQECPKCKGKGQVKLPTHVAGKDKRECSRCHGVGYLGPEGVERQNGLTGPTAYTPEQLESYTQAREDVDEWNEPRILPDGRENPNFGRMPNRKVLVEPWGVTAGLNVLDAVQ